MAHTTRSDYQTLTNAWRPPAPNVNIDMGHGLDIGADMHGQTCYLLLSWTGHRHCHRQLERILIQMGIICVHGTTNYLIKPSNGTCVVHTRLYKRTRVCQLLPNCIIPTVRMMMVASRRPSSEIRTLRIHGGASQVTPKATSSITRSSWAAARPTAGGGQGGSGGCKVGAVVVAY